MQTEFLPTHGDPVDYLQALSRGAWTTEQEHLARCKVAELSKATAAESPAGLPTEKPNISATTHRIVIPLLASLAITLTAVAVLYNRRLIPLTLASFVPLGLCWLEQPTPAKPAPEPQPSPAETALKECKAEHQLAMELVGFIYDGVGTYLNEKATAHVAEITKQFELRFGTAACGTAEFSTEERWYLENRLWDIAYKHEIRDDLRCAVRIARLDPDDMPPALRQGLEKLHRCISAYRHPALNKDPDTKSLVLTTSVTEASAVVL